MNTKSLLLNSHTPHGHRDGMGRNNLVYKDSAFWIKGLVEPNYIKIYFQTHIENCGFIWLGFVISAFEISAFIPIYSPIHFLDLAVKSIVEE